MLLCFVWSKKVASSSSGVVCGLISPFTIRDWLLTVSYWCAGEHSCWVCYGVSCPGCSISRLFCPSALPFSLLSSSQYFLTIEGVVQIPCLMPNIRFSLSKHPEQSRVSTLETLMLNKETFLSGMKCVVWKKLLGPLTCAQSESLLPGGRSSLLLLVSWPPFFTKFTERKLNYRTGRSVNIYVKAPDILKILGFE